MADNRRSPSDWVQNYRTGSFRAIEFYTDSSASPVGRRQVVHTFPKRDEPYVEDIGKVFKAFTMSVYINGSDYFDNRNKFIEALETSGTGWLVHPYLGTFEAVLLSGSFSETTTEGGMVRFDLVFQEQKQIQVVGSVKSPKKEGELAKKSFIEAIQEAFDEAYDISQLPAEYLTKISQTLNQGLAVITTARKTVGSVSDFRRGIDTLVGKYTQLVVETDAILEGVAYAFGFGSSMFSSDANFFAKYDIPSLEIAEAERRTEDSDSVQYQDTLISIYSRRMFQEYNGVQNGLDTTVSNNGNQDALLPQAKLTQVLMRLYTVIEQAGLYFNINFETLNEANEFAKIIFDNLDQIEEDPSSSNDIISAVRDMRYAVLSDKEERTAGLGVLYDYSITDEAMSPLVLSHLLYDNVGQEESIIARNKVSNPFFMEGPTAEVVINNA